MKHSSTSKKEKPLDDIGDEGNDNDEKITSSSHASTTNNTDEKKTKKSKKRLKEDSDSKHEEDEEGEEESKNLSAASVQEPTIHKNQDGDSYFDLSSKKRLTVRSWKGSLLIDIREVIELLFFCPVF